MSNDKTIRREIKALRRPFLREFFRENRFNLAMTLFSAVLMAAGELVISWLIKEIVDLISGISGFTFGALLAIAGGGLALMGLAAVIDYTFLSRFRAKAHVQFALCQGVLQAVLISVFDQGLQNQPGHRRVFHFRGQRLKIQVNAGGKAHILQLGVISGMGRFHG